VEAQLPQQQELREQLQRELQLQVPLQQKLQRQEFPQQGELQPQGRQQVALLQGQIRLGLQGLVPRRPELPQLEQPQLELQGWVHPPEPQLGAVQLLVVLRRTWREGTESFGEKDESTQ